MRHTLKALAAAAAFFCTPAAFAAPCFDAQSRPISSGPTDICNKVGATFGLKAGDILAYDENRQPLYQVHALPQKSKNAKPVLGIKDMSGRIIGPVQFQRVHVVSRMLGVGEYQEKNKPGRAFLIDLRTGDVSATPFTGIMMTYSFGPEPFLLGAVPGHYGVVEVLFPSGASTGLMLKDIHATTQDVIHEAERGLTTRGHALLSIGYGDALQFLTLKGETPAPGHKLIDGGALGVLAEVGPAPAGADGLVSQLRVPLNGYGQIPTLQSNFIGYVWGPAGSTYTAWRMPEGVRYRRLERNEKPNIAAPPSGELLSAVHFGERSDTNYERTQAGWNQMFQSTAYATLEDAKAAAAAFTAQLRAESANYEQVKRQQRAAEAAAREQRVAEARARMQRAKTENWAGPQLTSVQNEARFLDLVDEYERLGLYISDDFRRDVCNERASSMCASLPASPTYSGFGFTSTWEKAFENASALNQRQYNENCAAALKGAARACTIN